MDERDEIEGEGGDRDYGAMKDNGVNSFLFQFVSNSFTLP
jgi:hypothetical protein